MADHPRQFEKLAEILSDPSGEGELEKTTDGAAADSTPSVNSVSGARTLSLVSELHRLLCTYETISFKELVGQFPEHAEEIERAIRTAVGRNVSDHADHGPATQAAAAEAEPHEPPTTFGRYRVAEAIGSGGFGVVYKGWDEQLQRAVAIKVARRVMGSSESTDAYLEEARVLAGLDHPGIVPVYDVGQTPDGTLYIVSKFIDGMDLAHRLRATRLAYQISARIVADVAIALDCAHKYGIVHRDVKPGNILLTTDDSPVLVDFGLAIRDSDFGQGATFVGTPAYMSPEQAGQEGHRVDGRSDIYSLGAVLYRMLSATRPFNAPSLSALLDMIRHVEVRPPRQLDRAIPRELERICLKALSKRAADRYSTGRDMAEDLELWLAAGESTGKASTVIPSTPQTASTSSRSVSPAIMPRGLRSFEASDSEFFLELLPGPRDRDGLPEAVRFWKTRIEDTDADETFGVGVLLGPSGSGKSSLVRAGILPRLAPHVLTIAVETRPHDMEKRLLRRVKKLVPSLGSAQTLREALIAVRQNRGLSAGRKLLLVFDQFEQWLNYHRVGESVSLVEALRQCDGARVQALLLTRDDFTVAATQFMDQVEEPLSQTRNFATVEPFGEGHAEFVLTAFGRAYGALAEELPREQQRFVQAAIKGLAQDGSLMPIQLALFADMVKDKPWTMATLREYGGTRGIGVAFLQEKLTGPSAHPLLSSQQEPTRRILQLLLPDKQALIKGQARTRTELIHELAHQVRPDVLDRILGLLNSELRLIAPSGFDAASSVDSTSEDREPAYQLTHDYLVPTIREWLTSAERGTRRGRVKLRLEELAGVWTATPGPRHLPTFWEWCDIRLSTRSREWTKDQQRMMRAVQRRFAWRAGFALVASIVLLGAAYELNGRVGARAFHDRLLNAATAETPDIVAEAEPFGRWLVPRLRSTAMEQRLPDRTSPETPDSKRLFRRKLHLAFALCDSDDQQRQLLLENLDRLDPADLRVAAHFLQPHRDQASSKLWPRLEERVRRHEHNALALACALAYLDPQDPRWERVSADLATTLTGMRPFELPKWTEHFLPLKELLAAKLQESLEDGSPMPANQRSNVIDLLAIYASSQPELLVAALEHVNPSEFGRLFEPLEMHRERAAALLRNRFVALARPNAWKQGSEGEPLIADLTAELREHNGTLGPRAAIALSIPRDASSELLGRMFRSGYRPCSLRSYVGVEGEYVAVCWCRDGRTFRTEMGLTAENLIEMDQQLRQDGLQIVDIAFDSEVSGEEGLDGRFSALWVAADPSVDDVRVSVDKTLAEHVANAERWAEEGYLLRRFCQRAGPTGQPLCSAVWEKRTGNADDSSFTRSRYEYAFGDVYPGYLQTDCRTISLDTSRQDVFETHRNVQRNEGRTSPSDRATLAKVQSSLNMHDAAIAVLDELIENLPTNTKLAELRAIALAGRGDREGLLAETSRYESLEGSNSSVLALLRLRAAALGKDTQSAQKQLALLDQELEQAPDDAALTVTLARANALASLAHDGKEGTAPCVSRAIELLHRSIVDLGWEQREMLLTETDFNPLRPEARFQDLIRELGLDYRYDAVWQEVKDRESRMTTASNADNQVAHSKRLVAEGFVPICADLHQDVSTGELRSTVIWHREVPREEVRLREQQGLAILATALSHLRETEYLLDVLRGKHGLDCQSIVIAGLPETGFPPAPLARSFRQHDSAALRRNLLLVLGEYSIAALPNTDRDYFRVRVPELAADPARPELRSAAAWCARQWELESAPAVPDQEQGHGRGGSEVRSFVNGLEQRMIVLRPPGETLMGSPFWESGRGPSEQLQWIRIPRKYALAETETTVAQFRAFLESPRAQASSERRERSFSFTSRFAPDDLCPQVSVRWFDAARFCQWLSEEEGIPEDQWCYPGIWDSDKGLELPPDVLERTGYRLPTEAEWEYACRADSTTSRPYGNSASLLEAYAWYDANASDRAWPVGRLKPNAFGFFDMLGNVSEWCQDHFTPYRTPMKDFARIDAPRSLSILPQSYIVTRGGAYGTPARELRSANRMRQTASANNPIAGFRVARTIAD